MLISGTLIVPLKTNSLEIQKGCSEAKIQEIPGSGINEDFIP